MKALIFDTETTGLPFHRNAKLALQPKVIEFGALVLDHEGNELASMNEIVDPGCEIEPVITKITGLTNEDLKGKPKFADILPRIEALFSDCDVVVAHNLPFDMAMIDFELARLGREFVWPRIKLCTVQDNLPRYGKRPKLTELYEDVIGVPLAQTHRALDDCRALAEIVKKENYIGRIHSSIARQD